VCLIIPPRPYLLNQKALPNLGVLYVAEGFRRYGWDVTVLDFADGYRYVEADLYGITCTSADWHEAVKIKNWLKEQDKNTYVMIGGPHATLCPEMCVRAGFDLVVVGDGEVVARQVRKALEKDRKGVIKGFNKNIDSFHPARDLIDLWEYDFRVAGIRATSMMTMRSCAWRRCIFCSRCPEPWDTPRYHSAKYVDDDLKDIVEYGFDAICLYDDEFFTNPKRDIEVIRTIGRYGLTWRCFGKSDFILKRKELVVEAAKNGLAEVLLGIESGSAKILRIIKKGTTPEMNLEAIKFLHDLGIRVKAAMIVGLPGESRETLMETWRWLEKAEPYIDTYDFTIFTPYPGSDVYEHPERYDIKFSKNEIFTAYKGMHSPSWKPCRIETSRLSFEEIMAWRDALEQRFKFKNVEVEKPIPTSTPTT